MLLNMSQCFDNCWYIFLAGFFPARVVRESSPAEKKEKFCKSSDVSQIFFGFAMFKQRKANSVIRWNGPMLYRRKKLSQSYWNTWRCKGWSSIKPGEFIFLVLFVYVFQSLDLTSVIFIWQNTQNRTSSQYSLFISPIIRVTSMPKLVADNE